MDSSCSVSTRLREDLPCSRSPTRVLPAAMVLLALGACAHAPPPAPVPAPPTGTEATEIPEDLRRALAGTWVYAGGEAELATVDQAVDRATADMGFLARGFAYEALRARARPRDRYTLSVDGQTVTIASPDNPTERGEV